MAVILVLPFYVPLKANRQIKPIHIPLLTYLLTYLLTLGDSVLRAPSWQTTHTTCGLKWVVTLGTV